MDNSFVTAIGFESEDEDTYFRLIDFSASRVLRGDEKGIVVPVIKGFPMAMAEAGIQLGIPVMLVFPERQLDLDSWSSFWSFRFNHIFENSASKKYVKFPHIWILDYLKKENGLIYSMWDGDRGYDALFVRLAEREGVSVNSFFNDFIGGSL